MQNSLLDKTIKSSAWSIADVLLRQGIGFLISIVLARLLSPSDYGTIGVLMIFIAISNVFVDSGFSAGLIRKIDRTEDDLNTAFLFNIGVGIFVYFVIFIASPYISYFFDNHDLCLLLRVLGLTLIISSFNLVQNSILIFTMRIRQLTMVSALAQISTGVVAIYMAYNGWGVWALVFQQIASAAFTALLLFFTTGWRPGIKWSCASFSYLWSFGSKLLLTNFISTICGQMYSFFIGKYIGKNELGLYGRSDSFARQPLGIFNNIINKALVPFLAACQGNEERLRTNYRCCVEIMSFVGFPVMFYLSAIAAPLFTILFGAKWIDAIPLFQILCIGFSISIVGGISLQLIQVMGRSDYTLKLELIKKPFFVVFVIIGCSMGVKGIVIMSAFYELLGSLINLSVVHTLLHYSYYRQLIDIAKYGVISVIAFIPSVIIVNNLKANPFVLILLASIIYISAYLLIVLISQVKAIYYIREFITRRKCSPAT